MKIKTIYSTLCCLFLALPILSGCFLSESELKARRVNSLDISGVYAISVGLKTDFAFKIVNQSETHDIYVDLIRLNGLLRGERALLEEIKQLYELTSDDIFDQPRTMSLGKKDTSNLIGRDIRGGENVSTDFGESSVFRVCSEKVSYPANKKITGVVSGGKGLFNDTIVRIFLSYCFRGFVFKENRNTIQNGVISLYVDYQTQNWTGAHTFQGLDLDHGRLDYGRLSFKAEKALVQVMDLN